MRRTFFAIIMVMYLALLLTGCGKEVTLNLAYGERTGIYSGDVDANGVPHGQGKFTTTNAEGIEWTYEGDFKNGHFEGMGQTTWEDGQIEIGVYKDDVIVPMKGNEIKSLHTSPEKYKNHYVELVGVVFTSPEYFDGGVCVQMMADIENYTNNTIVYIYDDDFEVEQKDYLKVVGVVTNEFTGTNAMGGTVTAPAITATDYEVLSYIDACSPTLKTKELNQTQVQHGYSVTVQKIEYSSTETRVYVKVDNKGSDEFSVYSFNAKITQDGRQYEEQDNWDADYPEIQTELLVGNSTEGIIAFPALKEGPFTLLIEGRSGNWRESLAPFTFSVE